MTRNPRRILLSLPYLAVAGLATAGCGDGAGPDETAEFDAAEVTEAVELIVGPMDAGVEANFILSGFVNQVLVASAPATHSAFDRLRSPAADAGVDQTVRALSATLLQSRTADIPAELHGTTFVWDPASESWVDDPDRTGAPADGIRIIWYKIDEFGEPLVPLEEVGYIDLTEADTETLDRLDVLIVRTDGSADVTVADYVFGQGFSATGDQQTELVAVSGTFGAGTQARNVDIQGEATENTTTGDQVYSLSLSVAGSEGSYRWVVEGSLDGATGASSDDYLITVVQLGGGGQRTTILDLETTADAAGTTSGSGTLSHAGDVVANIGIDDFEFSYSRPGGGSFSAAQLAALDELTFYMFFSGPLLFFVLPFITV